MGVLTVTAPGRVRTLAQAAVQVVVDARGLPQRLDRAIRRAVREAGPRAARAGRELADSILGGLGRLTRGTAIVGLLTAALGGLSAASAGVVGALVPLAGTLPLLAAGGAAAAAGVAALAIGLQGVGDAITAVQEGDVEALNEALAELSPSARGFVREFERLGPAFERARLSVQEALFRDLGARLREVADATLPALQAGLTGTAGVLNSVAQRFATAVTSTQSIRDLPVIFTNINAAGGAAARAVNPLVAALRDIAVVGSASLPGIATSFANLAQRFGAFVAQARESGALAEFIEAGVAAAAQLGRILGNLGATLAAVFNASTAAGAGLLSTLERLTGSLREFVTSATGQAALGEFFTSLAATGAALFPVLTTLAVLIGSTLAPLIADIATAFGPALVAVVAALATAFSAAAPGITAFAEAIAAALGDPAVASALTAIGAALGDVLTQLAPQLPALAQALAGLVVAILPLAPALAEIVSGGLSLLLPVVQVLTPVVAEVADTVAFLVPVLRVLAPVALAAAAAFAVFVAVTSPVGLVVAAIAGLIVAIQAFASSDLPGIIGEFVVDSLAFLGRLAADTPGIIADFLGAVLAGLGRLAAAAPAAIGRFALALAAGLGRAFLAGLEALALFTVEFLVRLAVLPIQVLLILGALTVAFVQALIDLAPRALDALGAGLDALVQLATEWPPRILAAVASLPGLLLGLLTSMFATAQSLASRAFDAIVAFAASLPGRVIAGLSALPGLLLGLIGSAFTAARQRAEQVLNDLVSFVRSVPGRLLALAGTFANAGLGLIGAFIRGLSQVAGFVGDIGRQVVNGIIRFVNRNVIDRINDLLEFTIDPPGPGPTLTINAPNIDHIPELQRGGIVEDPGLFLLGERGRREAVLPLEDPRRTRAILGEPGVADALIAALGGGTRTTATPTVINNTFNIESPTPNVEALSHMVGARFLTAVR